MILTLLRHRAVGPATLGTLHINGEFSCFTLEDQIREGPKVPGMTAIPAGRYRVDISMSRRFGRELPILREVPGFEGIRIHCGNTTADTEGCILVGRTQDVFAGTIGQSRLALSDLQPQIREAWDTGEEVWIEIRNEIEP
jgi:hypothetical protein